MAPDNGVLSYIVGEVEKTTTMPTRDFPPQTETKKLGRGFRAVNITNPACWHQPVSTIFHGRDIFSPVAAHLSLGVPMKQFGDALSHVYAFPIPQPYRDARGQLIGHVLHIDNFGNLITDVRSRDLTGRGITITIGKRRISGLSQFYTEKEGLAAIIDSSGYLEISLNKGSAAAYLKAKVGDKIKLELEQ